MSGLYLALITTWAGLGEVINKYVPFTDTFLSGSFTSVCIQHIITICHNVLFWDGKVWQNTSEVLDGIKTEYISLLWCSCNLRGEKRLCYIMYNVIIFQLKLCLDCQSNHYNLHIITLFLRLVHLRGRELLCKYALAVFNSVCINLPWCSS